MLHTAEMISVVCCTQRRSTRQWDAHCRYYFVIAYLGEIETEFKNTLGCLSGAQVGAYHEKNKGKTFCDTLPLIKHLLQKYPFWEL